MQDETVTRFYHNPPGGDRPGHAGSPAQLVVVEGTARGEILELNLPAVRIGRKPDNDLVLATLAVSKYHARIVGEEGSFVVEDLGSTNGVTINGVPLEPLSRRKLFHGDNLGIGDHLLIFRQAGGGGFTDKTGMSTISFDAERVRKEADELLRELPGFPPRRPS